MSDRRWRIYLLGTLEAQSEQKTLTHLSMRRIGALLACLALRAPQPVSREVLLDLLWPEEEPEISRNRLRVLLSSLRRHLEAPDDSEPVLAAERTSVRLLPAAFTSDYHDFLQALDTAASASEVNERIAALEQAVTLYRGELLAGFYDEWILSERYRLAQLRYQALRDLTSCLRRNAAPARAVEYARQAVSLEPLDEEAHCDLIRLYWEIGQPSAALRQYQQLAQLLQEELQAVPSEQARLLATQIEAEIGHGTAPTKRVVRPTVLRVAEKEASEGLLPDTLPVRLTQFFGREEEIVQLCALLSTDSTTRLVSLLGPGGTGKTRLAIETAERLRETYSGRVYFAPLAEIADSHYIGRVIARALRLPPTPGIDPLSQAMAVLSQAPSLLILDNLEQLLPDAGALIEHLLLETPSLRCLLTSRRSIGIEGEQEIALEPLPQPSADADIEEMSASPGIALFVDRVRLIRADFVLTSTNAKEVALLCRTLEGLPLAIELAAARARVMTPAEMRQQAKSLLHWLVDTRGGKTARHRSLRAALEWSYRLLTLDERRFFCALAVFVGPFTAEAAGCVGQGKEADQGEALAMLERLCASSLLNVTEREETTRFGMLETLREFGQERLAETGTASEIRRRHLAYCVERLCERAESPREWTADAMAIASAEDGNVREALEFGLRPEANTEEQGLVLRLVLRLASFWERQGRWSEGRDYLRRASLLREATVRPETKAALLRAAGNLATHLGDYGEAHSLSQEGLRLAQAASDIAGIAGCLSNLSAIAFFRDDYAGAQELGELALEVCRQTEDATSSAACLVSLGNVAFYLGDHRLAQERLQEALRLYRQAEDRHGIAGALLRLGNVQRNQGYVAEGRVHLMEAMEVFQETDDRRGIAVCLHDIGLAAMTEGDYPEAQRCYVQALAQFEEIGSQRGVNTCNINLGSVMLEQGDYEEAWARYSKAVEIYRKIGDRRNLAAGLFSLGGIALDRGAFNEAAERLTEALTIEQEISNRGGIANCQVALGRLALARKNYTQAFQGFSEALTLYYEMDIAGGVALLLEAHAHLAWRMERALPAVRLVGAATALRGRIGVARPGSARSSEAVLAEIRATLAEPEAAAAWEEGEHLSTAAAVALALQFPPDSPSDNAT